MSTILMNEITTPLSDDIDIQLTPPYIYILIEFLYLILFGLSAYLIRRFNFMKTDEDAVTKHHRRHYEMMKSQQEELIKKQSENENFLVAKEDE